MIIAMVCSDPPEGRARWTVRLVAEAKAETIHLVMDNLNEPRLRRRPPRPTDLLHRFQRGPVHVGGGLTAVEVNLQLFSPVAISVGSGFCSGRSLSAEGGPGDGDGASERSIMNQTGHRSVQMVRRFIRDGSLFRENSAEKLGL